MTAINTYDPTNKNGLFNVLGEVFGIMSALNTESAATVPGYVGELSGKINALTETSPSTAVVAAQSALQSALQTWSSQAAPLVSQLNIFAAQYLISVVTAAAPETPQTIYDCMNVLLGQMQTNGTVQDGGGQARGTYVAPVATISAAVSYASTNVGNMLVVADVTRGDGLVQQTIFVEQIVGTVLTAETAGVPAQIQFVGQPATSAALASTWPLGSGITATVTETTPSSSLLYNGSFALATVANVPDGWTVLVGTPGTNIKLTSNAVQTVSIPTSTTSGSFVLQWQSAGGTYYSTGQLPYNVTAATMQTALSAFPGLSGITVSSAVVSTNTVFTVTFNNCTGVPATLSKLNDTTNGGGVSIALVTFGQRRQLRRHRPGAGRERDHLARDRATPDLDRRHNLLLLRQTGERRLRNDRHGQFRDLRRHRQR